jgi:predicted methyltransferase
MFHKIVLIIITLNLFTACQKPPEPKNEFERAVFNGQRFAEDIEQDERRKPVEILTFSRLKTGSKVLDFMAGGGYYSELFSYLVGSQGVVYLHNVPSKAKREDIQQKIAARLENNRLPNVKAVAFEPTQFQLPEKVDLVFLSKVFHDFYVPSPSKEREETIAQFLQQLKENLSPGGHVLIIDHSAPSGSGVEYTQSNHRIDEAFVVKLFENQGFKLIATADTLRSPDDDRTLNIWDGKVRNRTDQFVLLFELQ